MKTIEAIAHERKLEAENNLKNNSHYYDELVAAFMVCRRCNGSGEVIDNTNIGEWESEGGPAAKPILCDCKGERAKITEDMVRRFFDLPVASRDIVIKTRRSGVCGFDVSIHVMLNPALQDNAMMLLDELLFNDKNLQWLSSINQWHIDYQNGVSYRHFSGDSKEALTLLQKWTKNCEQKFGKKNFRAESLLQS
jgi:hypothetical protein